MSNEFSVTCCTLSSVATVILLTRTRVPGRLPRPRERLLRRPGASPVFVDIEGVGRDLARAGGLSGRSRARVQPRVLRDSPPRIPCGRCDVSLMLCGEIAGSSV